MTIIENEQLKLHEEDLKIIKYARMCFEQVFDLKEEIYPKTFNVIAKLARILEFSGNESDMMCCSNCHYWEFNNPEANGESTGICKNLSSGKDDYFPVLSVRIALENKCYLEEQVIYTRSSFMCNKFSRNTNDT